MSLVAWLGLLIAGFATLATPAETPRVDAAVRGPLVPDAVQCTGSKPGDCRAHVAQPDDGNKVLRNSGDGLQMLWMNSAGFPLVPPGALVSNATLIVRAVEVNSASLAVRSQDDGAPIATVIGSPSAAETRELTGPSLVATVRDAMTSGKDLTLQLTISPPSGGTNPALEIDFVALSIEYQPGAVTVVPASPTPTPTATATPVASPSPTPIPPGGSGGGSGGSGAGQQPSGGNPSAGAQTGTGANGLPSGTTGGGLSNNSATTMVTASWLDLPPAVPAARTSCPSNGIWSLLYWNGPNDTAIVSASPICATGDRFWVFRNGRWLGYSPLFPTASDTWAALSGEAHFVRGRVF
jgi:hypothetical protein